MEDIVGWLAENKIDKELLNRLITSLLMNDEYSEALKLDLIQAVSDWHQSLVAAITKNQVDKLWHWSLPKRN